MTTMMSTPPGEADSGKKNDAVMLTRDQLLAYPANTCLTVGRRVTAFEDATASRLLILRRVTAAYARAPVAPVLERLRAYADVEDPLATSRLREREAEIGRRLETGEKYEFHGDDPPLAIRDEVGALLYVVVRARRPTRAIEFGASHGLSTIYIASALKDAAHGSLVTTELRPMKAEATRANLASAGLGDLVEVRTGDALETLRELEGPVEFVFLDGRNDFYLPVLELLEPSLAPGAVVAADLSIDDPDLIPYLDYVRRDGGRYASTTVPLDAGLEVSVLTD
jgi:predicted O-methyltransferase YrrM